MWLVCFCGFHFFCAFFLIVTLQEKIIHNPKLIIIIFGVYCYSLSLYELMIVRKRWHLLGDSFVLGTRLSAHEPYNVTQLSQISEVGIIICIRLRRK